jgi:hypothetical protein
VEFREVDRRHGKKKRLAGMVGEACGPERSCPLLSARTSTGPVMGVAVMVKAVVAAQGGQGQEHWA